MDQPTGAISVYCLYHTALCEVKLEPGEYWRVEFLSMHPGIFTLNIGYEGFDHPLYTQNVLMGMYSHFNLDIIRREVNSAMHLFRMRLRSRLDAAE